jgi:hypothetical protein
LVHRQVFYNVNHATILTCITDFKQQCSALYQADGDVARSASDNDKAITLYTVAIDLAAAGSDTIFIKRSKAELDMKLWEEALLDAQKVRKVSVVSWTMLILVTNRSSNSTLRLILDTS